jgi:hypothetical protein
MRSLSVVDVIIITAVLALLFFLSTKDFHRYGGRSFGATPAAEEKG